jgi:hypothetical protein
MMNHRRRQHFLRQFEELDRDVSRNDRRVLDEVGHFLKQRRLRRDEPAHTGAKFARMGLELATDPLLALGSIEDDEVFEQPRLIVVERLDLDRATGSPACRQEAVAVGVGPGTNVLDCRPLRQLGSPDDERYHASAVQENEPSDWTRERQVALSVLEIRIPPHLLRKCHVAKQSPHQLREHVDRRFAALSNAIRQVATLGCLLPFQRLDFDAVLLRKSNRRRRGLPVGFECR